MTTAPTTNFLGIPIDGEINHSETKAAQRPLSELEPLIRAVLDDPTIADFGWTQYTPFFNDGDPCTFGIGDPWFRTTDDVNAPAEGDEDGEDHGDMYRYELWNHPNLGERPGTYNHKTSTYEYGAYTGPNEGRYDRVAALHAAISSEAFNDVLLEAFGDHARVAVRRTGITVTFYQHD